MTKRKKRAKRLPPTELEVTREAMRKQGVYAIKPYKARKWFVLKIMRANRPAGNGDYMELYSLTELNTGNLLKFPSEVLAYRNVMLLDFTKLRWRRG